MTRVFDFFKEVKVELQKVVWPTPEQTIRLTAIVILVAITVGFFVGIVDALLSQALKTLLSFRS